MYHEQQINLNFSLLGDFASAASKQFKILKRATKNNLNNQLHQTLNFPSKQLCLEILARGFGFENYEEAKKDRSNVELRLFVFPYQFLKKIYSRQNTELAGLTGYYFIQWHKVVQSVFSSVFSLKHSTLSLYAGMKVAQLNSFGIVFGVLPFNNLISNAVDSYIEGSCEPEDSLFVLNFLCLVLQDIYKNQNGGFYLEDGKDSLCLRMKYKDVFLKPPMCSQGVEAGIAYLTDAMFEADYLKFVVQLTNYSGEQEMECMFDLVFSADASRALLEAKKIDDSVALCKKSLDKLLEVDYREFGLSGSEDLVLGQSQQYMGFLRTALVQVGFFFVEEGSGRLLINNDHIRSKTSHTELKAIVESKLSKSVIFASSLA